MFAACMIAAAFSSGPGYLGEMGLAGKSTDFSRDYVAARWIADGKSVTDLNGAAGNAESVRLGSEAAVVPCGAFHLHPPPASILVRALLPLGFRRAAIAWMMISVAAMTVLARVLLALLRPSTAVATLGETVAASLAVLAWPPTIMNIAYGQWSLLLAALVAIGWFCLERGRTRSAALALAAAVALKGTPSTVLGYLAFGRRRMLLRVLGAVLVIVAVLVAVTWPFAGGLSAWRALFRDGTPSAICWEGYVDNTVSLNGLFVRLLVGGEFIVSPFHAPGLAHVLVPATSAALIALAAIVTWQAAAAHAGETNAPSFAMWASLTALLNPLSWTHNALFLLLPATLVARPTSRRSVRIAVAVALIALTVPRRTLFLLARPVPFGPSRAWILGLHAMAGLTLFFCAAIEARWPSGREPVGVGSGHPELERQTRSHAPR